MSAAAEAVEQTAEDTDVPCTPELLDDGSIRAAIQKYWRELRGRRKRRTMAGKEELAELDAAVRQSRELIYSRFHDPVNADEVKQLTANQRKICSHKPLGSPSPEPPAWVTDAATGRKHALWHSTGDDSTLVAAQLLRTKALDTLHRGRKAGASLEVLASLEAAHSASKELLKQRYRDPRNAEEAEGIRAYHRLAYRKHVSNHPEKVKARRRAYRARFGSSQRPSTRLSPMRANGAIVDDGSILAAIKSYHQMVRRRTNAALSGSKEEMAELDAAVRQSKELVYSRSHDPVNAEEKESLPASYRKLCGQTPRDPRDSIAPEPSAWVTDAGTGIQYPLWNSTGNDSSIRAAWNLRPKAISARTRARKAGASAEVLASLEAAYSASKELSKQRFHDPRNAKEAQKERARQRVAENKYIAKSAEKLKARYMAYPARLRASEPSPTRKLQDDGSIRAARSLYQQETFRRRMMKLTASKEELAQANKVVLDSRRLFNERLFDPARAEEKQRLPPSYQCIVQADRFTNEANWIVDAKNGKTYQLYRNTGEDCSVLAARKLRQNASNALKRARAAEASAEVLRALKEALEAGKQLYRQRMRDPRNAREAEEVRAESRVSMAKHRAQKEEGLKTK